MSHFTKINSRIKNLEILKQTLNEMNIPWEVNTKITGWRRNRRKTDIAINFSGELKLGLVGENDDYVVLCDWYTMSRSDYTQWDKIQTQYALNTIKEQAKVQGWEIENIEQTSEGLKVVVGGWV